MVQQPHSPCNGNGAGVSYSPPFPPPSVSVAVLGSGRRRHRVQVVSAPERALGWGLGVEPRVLHVMSGAWPRHCPRAKRAGKGPSRARGVHLTWHGRPICRLGEAIVLLLRRPVSLKTAPRPISKSIPRPV